MITWNGQQVSPRKQESKKGTLHFPCIPKIEVGHNSYPNDELRKICVGDAYIKDAHGNPVSWKRTVNIELVSDGTILNIQKMRNKIPKTIEMANKKFYIMGNILYFFRNFLSDYLPS